MIMNLLSYLRLVLIFAVGLRMVAAFRGINVPSKSASIFMSNSNNNAKYNPNLQQKVFRKLFPQPTWRLKEKMDDVRVIDVLAVLSRFQQREDFYQGKGYSRAMGLLTNEGFYEKIKSMPYKRWPLDNSGKPFASELAQNKQELEALQKEVKSLIPSKAAADAVFTSFAKGATNGVAYPKQVDEEMSKWLSSEGSFNLQNFELSLLLGRLYVFIGWFLYIGLQFGGVYVVFFVPIMSQFFPDVDFYPVQTYLHTSEWGK